MEEEEGTTNGRDERGVQVRKSVCRTTMPIAVVVVVQAGPANAKVGGWNLLWVVDCAVGR